VKTKVPIDSNEVDPSIEKPTQEPTENKTTEKSKGVAITQESSEKKETTSKAAGETQIPIPTMANETIVPSTTQEPSEGQHQIYPSTSGHDEA
jgi:hypothetical protein